MSKQAPHYVLVVDDEESIRRLLKNELSSGDRIVHTAENAQFARQALKKQQYDVIILDIRLPDADGLDLFAEFKMAAQDVEIILITGHGDIDNAVEAMRMGVFDYITKPCKLDRLEVVIDRAYQRVCLQRENKGLRHTQASKSEWCNLIGRSAPIQEIKFLIDKLTNSEVPVLITGESGVGKDVVARAIHERCPRSAQPLIIKNCAMLYREMVRSELFGHKKGAFTGATEAHEGLVSVAYKGTLFLDEIGDLPEDVQASLLRLLETKMYRRMGENKERRADVRFLFATNRDLGKAVEEGTFNEALYHRINVFNIHIPRLRERKEDLPLLVEHFLSLLSNGRPPADMPEKTMKRLLAYDWPGNVRELRNVLERALILSEGRAVTENCLPKELLDTGHGQRDAPPMSLEKMEREHIAQVLSIYHGSKQKAAQALNIGRKTLYRKIQKYGLDQ